MRMPVSWMKSLSESFSQPFGTPLAMEVSFVWKRDYTGRRAARDKKREADRAALFALPGELPLGVILLRRGRRGRRLLVLGRGDQRNVRGFVPRGRRGLAVDDRKHPRRLLHPALGLVGQELQLRLDVGTLLEDRGLGRGIRVGLARGSRLDLRLGDVAERGQLDGLRHGLLRRSFLGGF